MEIPKPKFFDILVADELRQKQDEVELPEPKNQEMFRLISFGTPGFANLLPDEACQSHKTQQRRRIVSNITEKTIGLDHTIEDSDEKKFA